VSIHILKRGLGIVLAAAAAMAVALPVGNAHAYGFCTYLGERYERGDQIVTPNHNAYVCISTDVGMFWKYVPWTP
jgi:hypothetical protein